jgi:hypothetical protein
MQLTVSINRMYEDTTQRLEAALAVVCNDFRPDHYSKVSQVAGPTGVSWLPRLALFRWEATSRRAGSTLSPRFPHWLAALCTSLCPWCVACLVHA